jgi:hypothetical protein
MSKGNLISRLDAVERHLPAVRPVMLWTCEGVRTRAEAIAEQYPGGLPPGAPVYILEWGIAK